MPIPEPRLWPAGLWAPPSPSPGGHRLLPRPPWMGSALCSGTSLLPVSLAARSAPGRQGFLSVLLMAVSTPPCPWTAPGPQLALRKHLLSEHAASTGTALFSHSSSPQGKSRLGTREGLFGSPSPMPGGWGNLCHGSEGPPQSYRMGGAGGWRLEAEGQWQPGFLTFLPSSHPLPNRPTVWGART